MKDKFFWGLFLITCFTVQSAVAQEDNVEKISITVSMFDSLREYKKLWTDSATVLSDSCNKLSRDVSILKDSITTLNAELERNKRLSFMIEKKDSLIAILQKQHDEDRLQLVMSQEIADNAIAKYANGRLYFKYDAERIEKCRKDIDNIKTKSIKEKFSQLPNLLKNYGKYSVELKGLLLSAQNDSGRKEKYNADDYKSRCVNLITSWPYYLNYYDKINSGVWSIPYLDNIIEVALSILQKHDPGHYDYVNFTPLIDML